MVRRLHRPTAPLQQRAEDGEEATGNRVAAGGRVVDRPGLNDLSAEALRKEHGVEVDVVVCDLGKPDGARALFSIGGFLPTPRFASYGAGKSYVRNFSEALAYELADSGVRVCCLCPGATETEFSDVAGLKLQPWQKLVFMSAERCARIGLGALFRGRRSIVSGLLNSFAMFLTRFIPRRLATAIAAKAL
jgi:short-subunit dehydrogenase